MLTQYLYSIRGIETLSRAISSTIYVAIFFSIALSKHTLLLEFLTVLVDYITSHSSTNINRPKFVSLFVAPSR